MRPDRTFLTSVGEAFRKGAGAAAQNWPAMLSLLGAMAVVVLSYYGWPAAHGFLSICAVWVHQGGLFRVALTAGFAGGILSELTLVYVQDKGRWHARHLENMLFRFILFFFGGMVVAKFYEYQAGWFGDSTAWPTIARKVLVDQLVFSVFWSTTYQAIAFRWQALRYSGPLLWKELNWDFVTGRMLPVLVTNWLFWIPGVTLVYSMPLLLQMPLNIFATAMWSLLLASLSKPAAAPIAVGSPNLVRNRPNPAATPAD